MKKTYYDWQLTAQCPMSYRIARQWPDRKAPQNLDFHQSMHVYINLTGHGRLNAGQDCVTLPCRQVFFTAPYELHGSLYRENNCLFLTLTLEERMLFPCMLFLGEKMHRLAGMPASLRQQCLQTPGNGEATERYLTDILGDGWANGLEEAMLRKIPTPPELNERITMNLPHLWNRTIELLMDVMDALPELPPLPKQSYAQTLMPALKLLAGNSRRTTQQECASACNCSISSFRQHFHAHFGMPFAQFERNIRLKNAACDLKDGQLSIKEIAQKYDFYDASHFTHLFRQKYHVSPGEYLASPMSDTVK